MSKRYKYELRLDQLPMMFDTSFGNYHCSLQINYNEVGDFYTVDSSDSDAFNHDDDFFGILQL